MFFCHNQSCGARWAPDEVEIHNEGQGPLFAARSAARVTT